MAERAALYTNISGGVLLRWLGLTATDTGEKVEPGKASGAISAIQFVGTFGGTVTLQGSNDGVTWTTLKDIGGSDISTTGTNIFDISTAARYVRPSAGSGVVDVDVYMTMRTG